MQHFWVSKVPVSKYLWTWKLLKTGGHCEKAHLFKTQEVLSIRSKETLQQSLHLLNLIKPLKDSSSLLHHYLVHSNFIQLAQKSSF